MISGACESMTDSRTEGYEHLGTTDKAIIKHRRKLIKASEIGRWKGGDRSELPLQCERSVAKSIQRPCLLVDAVAPT